MRKNTEQTKGAGTKAVCSRKGVFEALLKSSSATILLSRLALFVLKNNNSRALGTLHTNCNHGLSSRKSNVSNNCDVCTNVKFENESH